MARSGYIEIKLEITISYIVFRNWLRHHCKSFSGGDLRILQNAVFIGSPAWSLFVYILMD
jgi:hypothetical protein